MHRWKCREWLRERLGVRFFSNQKLNIFLFFFSPVNSLAFLDSVILLFLEEKQLNVVHCIPWMELEVVAGGEEEGGWRCTCWGCWDEVVVGTAAWF